MGLTLKEAKVLSEKKWQAIVDNDGDDYKIEELVPEVSGLYNECPMCEFVIKQNGLFCFSCIYHNTACELSYSDWTSHKSKKTAQAVLDEIKESNK